jgi:threonine/homoserine/homoserine lactone efflux protein
MLNVAGIQFGLALTMVVVLLGLTSLISAMGDWFVWVRLAGAAYLIWLGWKMLKASGDVGPVSTADEPRGGFLVQGLAVALSNPKTLLFFGAFFPQFIDPSRDFAIQVLVMGTTAMALAALSDSAYALLASRAGVVLSRRRVQALSSAGGVMLVGGGLWLALSRSK